MPHELFEAGEYKLGGYKVQFAHWEGGEWCGAGYWQRAVVTNRRLLVFPDARHTDQAQKIASDDIVRVWNICLGKRDGVLVSLKDGLRFYMLVDWSQGSKLVRDIQEMIALPLHPRIAHRLRPV